MTVARAQIVDPELTPWYHCISRCVRRAFLCGPGFEHRKDWIERRLEKLADTFAVAVAGYAVMDNHLHVLVRLEPERVGDWSDREVVVRWGRLFPPRGADRKPLQLTKAWIAEKLANAEWVARARGRLADLGWFMKCLKEPLARLANREDDCRGAFWESRYKSIALLDEPSLVATCAYIDLNPVAAGVARLPEESTHTSLKTRVEHCRERGRLDELRQAHAGGAAAIDACRGLEEGLWLCPIDDRRERAACRAGLLPGFSLASYLQLIDWTSRLVRQGKASVGREVRSLLDRLGTSADRWESTLQRLFSRRRTTGVAFAFSREPLRAAAARRGQRHLANRSGCPA